MKYHHCPLTIGLIILIVCIVGCTSTAPSTQVPTPVIQDHKYQWGDVVADNQTGDMIIIINSGIEPGKYLVAGVIKGDGIGNYYREGEGSDHILFADIESRYTQRVGWLDPLKLQRAPTIINSETVPTSTAVEKGSKYTVGDLFYDKTNTFDNELKTDYSYVVYAVDNVNRNYTLDVVFRKQGETQWKRSYPSNIVNSMDFIENKFPYLVGHIDISKIFTEYPSQAAYYAANSLGSAITSTTTYSSQSLSTSSTHFSGGGDDVRSFTATGTGLRVFSMSYSGQHNFAIELYDSEGNYVDLLANEIGLYSGKKTAKLSTGKYTFDITASGPWTIDISSA
jgi:hypothetical protein